MQVAVVLVVIELPRQKDLVDHHHLRKLHFVLTVQTYTFRITVGTGGAGGVGGNAPGSRGTHSAIAGPDITTVSSEGGGGGMNDNDSTTPLPGGSGGGGTYNQDGGTGNRNP